jgi:hypothetical protein
MTDSAKELVDVLVNLFPSDEELTDGLEVGGGREMRLREALEGFAADGFVTEMVADSSFRAERTGIDGFIEAWDDWLEAFQSFRIDLDESVEIGDTLLTLVTLTGVPRGGATELVNDNAAVWFLKGGRLARVEFHMDREMARRSAEAGLPSD